MSISLITDDEHAQKVNKWLCISIPAFTAPEVFDQVVREVVMSSAALIEVSADCSPLAFDALGVGSIVGNEFHGMVDHSMLIP